VTEWKAIKISPEEWAKGFSENIHKVVFKEIRSASEDRISYAILVVKNEDVVGYVTVRELDNDSVYWHFGGAVPKFRKSIIAARGILTLLDFQKGLTKRIVTYVQNTNLPMLRFYLTYGFIIIGIRAYGNKVFVDLVKELHGN
jgi:RimJ/RimL family protein N-acetyltransferase